jgi:hypothetical protein
MRRQAGCSLILAAALAAGVTPRPARAQMPPGAMGSAGPGGMPDLRAISGRPLPDRGMPAGTVTVRVARKMPVNGVAGAEVVAIIKNGGGDLRKRTAKTDGSGRAMFEGLTPGDSFKAEVTVDGEKLATEDITMPPEGGVRTMLIAGLGSAPAGGGAGGGDEAEFSMGAATGTSHPDPALPAQTLEVRVLDEAGKPVPGIEVMLGAVDQSSKVSVRRAHADAAGAARFTDLPTGPGTAYAAVVDWHGTRIGTDPFSMPEAGGTRAEIRAMERTSDPSVIAIGTGGRIVLQMHEDVLQFLEILPIENRSAKMFDPGPGAVEIPLPKGFVSAEAAESERKIEVRQNHGVAVHGVFPPKRAAGGADGKATAGNEITLGFVLPYHGDTRAFEQPMPNGIGPFVLITEQIPGLMVTGPGVGARESRELSGRKYWISPVEAIAPGGVLQLSITGLPSTDATGRIVAGGLALGLIGAAIAFGRRPQGEARRAASNERERLTARREALFAELVAVEQAGRSGASAASAPERRRDLIGKLEGIYQQLAALDEQRAL